MAYSDDEIAGVVGLFGALTREELESALAELSFRRGDGYTDEELAQSIENALATYGLVAVETDPAVLVAGPATFPELPASADDLPHMLDVDRAAPDRELAAGAAERQLREDVAIAVEAGDDEELQQLLDVTYELESWGPVDLAELRERIDEALS